ncbi:hypothetical protein AVEN_58656-1 [Araneus ventricosus]|uniref:Histone-lysine N-methyltransferase SETMAR n=1 Tax=Araneus ventricosus TaxID=182803 RepID=A0A4Y2L837_ARAVE|nr:hypothetical protein AVEN_58656-1 [Araneus ventricosus]
MELIDHRAVLGPSASSLAQAVAEGFPDDFSLPWLKLTNGSVSPPPTTPLVLVYWYCITEETTTEALMLLLGLRVERRHHLQSVCLQEAVLVDKTDENLLGLFLGCNVNAVALTNETFHLFGQLKQHLGGKHFAVDDDVQQEALLWMRQQPKEFYAAGIGALIKRWDKCINIGGDYVEK